MGTYRPKNILITGAAGFIASHVANRLVRNYPHYNIVVLDKLDYCSNLKNLNPSSSSLNFKFIKGDIGSADLVNFILFTESIDTIMHFAAQTHVDNSFGNSFEFTHNNIYGTHVLLEACKVMSPPGQIRRFIHVSTDEVYGETDGDAVVGNHEASQLLPTNPYSASKAGAEMLVMAYGRSYGLPVITTRGNNVYGTNQFPEKLIPKFLLLAMKGQPLPIHGDGSNVRSYLYCEDVAEAFEIILHKGEIGHVYNIGTDKERSVLDVAMDICKLFSLDPKTMITFVENRPFNDQRYFLDHQKLNKLGWSERTLWDEGLKKTMEWYVQNPDWWGDVSGALLPHPRMLMMPGMGSTASSSSSSEKSKSLSQNGAHVKSNNIMKIIQSEKSSSMKFLIYGRSGLIGSMLEKLCEKQGISFEYGKGSLQERSQLVSDIRNVKPTHVLNVACVTTEPVLGWYESQKTDTISNYVVGILNLADVCRDHRLYMLNLGTSCMFDYNQSNEEQSFYSKTRMMVEEILREHGNVCILRLRMPISSLDLEAIKRIVEYEVKVPNSWPWSMSVLDELLPISIDMAKRNLKGTWNFTNPGAISHNEILEMYREYIDPNFSCKTNNLFGQGEEAEEESYLYKSKKEMDLSKLKEFPEILPIKESLIKYVFEPNKKKGH